MARHWFRACLHQRSWISQTEVGRHQQLDLFIMAITIETTVAAPMNQVWKAYTTPDDIVQWNAASDDWHTTSAQVDLREGGTFSSRMEAKDGSAGFDFGGTYTKVQEHEMI